MGSNEQANKYSALYVAVNEGNIDIVKLLLSYPDIDIDIEIKRDIFN